VCAYRVHTTITQRANSPAEPRRRHHPRESRPCRPCSDVGSATRLALRTLARRVLELDSEVAPLDQVREPLVAATAPEPVAQVGVGTDTAGALLVAAGQNTSRLRTERSFARLCGAAPLDASSGK
jgi:transposase